LSFATHLCLGLDRSEAGCLAIGDVVLAVLVGELLLVPALLGDLLCRFLAVGWVGADGGVAFLVHGLDLQIRIRKKKGSDLVSFHKHTKKIICVGDNTRFRNDTKEKAKAHSKGMGRENVRNLQEVIAKEKFRKTLN